MANPAKLHMVNARLWEPIEPIDRGERYEDPLEAALGARRLGAVTGGGSQLTELGEIEFADVNIDLVNLDDALDLVRRVLEEAGAPLGSELSFERAGRTEVLPFGRTECLALYLDGVSLPDEVYTQTDINDLADEITTALATQSGEIRGSWQGPTETSIYVYGQNAEGMFVTLQPLLRRDPQCQNARIVIRHGNPKLSPRTVRLPRHG